jgi:hypothetical protein
MSTAESFFLTLARLVTKYHETSVNVSQLRENAPPDHPSVKRIKSAMDLQAYFDEEDNIAVDKIKHDADLRKLVSEQDTLYKSIVDMIPESMKGTIFCIPHYGGYIEVEKYWSSNRGWVVSIVPRKGDGEESYCDD